MLKKKKEPSRKCAINDIKFTEQLQMANKHEKIFNFTREMKIKIKRYFSLNRHAKIIESNNIQ